jgi:hypothetical protein
MWLIANEISSLRIADIRQLICGRRSKHLDHQNKHLEIVFAREQRARSIVGEKFGENATHRPNINRLKL